MYKKHLQTVEVIGITLILTATAIGFYFSNQIIGNKDSNTLNGNISALILDYGNGKQRKFEGPVTDNMNIIKALLASENGGKLKVKFTKRKNDKNIELLSIDGRGNNSNGYQWNFYINGQLVKTSEIGSVAIRAGDLIKARYEKTP